MKRKKEKLMQSERKNRTKRKHKRKQRDVHRMKRIGANVKEERISKWRQEELWNRGSKEICRSKDLMRIWPNNNKESILKQTTCLRVF